MLLNVSPVRVRLVALLEQRASCRSEHRVTCRNNVNCICDCAHATGLKSRTFAFIALSLSLSLARSLRGLRSPLQLFLQLFPPPLRSAVPVVFKMCCSCGWGRREVSEESIVCGGGEGSFERGTHRHRVELVLALRQLSFQQVHCIEDLRGV